MAHGPNCETCGGACAWEPDDDCQECEGSGVHVFCPSFPDKCGGCEEEPCRRCKGSGKEPCRHPEEARVHKYGGSACADCGDILSEPDHYE